MIEKQFPRSITLRWNYSDVVSIHYFGRNKEMFCLIKGQWWQIEYHWDHIDYGEGEIQDYPEVDKVRKVSEPSDIVYSHTIEDEDWCDSIPMAILVGGELGGNLYLGSYPAV